MRASARAMARMNIAYIARVEDALIEAETKGNTIYAPEADLIGPVDAYREKALTGVYDTARDNYCITNAEEVIDDFRATWDKWEGLIAGVDRTDENALTAFAMREIYDTLDPATGTIAASGTLGSLIQPSVLLILSGVYAQPSVGQQFLAGFIPGLVSALI